MARGVYFLNALVIAFGMLLLFGTGCPSLNENTPSLIIKALSGDGCRGCDGCAPEEGEEPEEGEGEVPTEGEGEVQPEGEGEAPIEGEGEILPEGEGEAPVEGEGEVQSEGEGEVLTEGEGEAADEGEGEALPEGEGELPMEGEPVVVVVVVPGALVDVPAGTFQMGDPWNEGWEEEVPVHAVTLDAYRIGKYEVTNQEYADVLNWAHGRGYLQNSSGAAYTGGLIYAYNQPIADTETSSSYSQLTYSGGVFGVRSRIGYNSQSFSMADHPMVNVSWYGAVCYCNWLSEQQGLQACYDTATWTRYTPVRNGYRLPTEAEWERAAAWDGSRHWRYGMTSDTIDFTRANYDESGYANPLGLTSSPYTSPVGWYNGVNPARVDAPGTLTVNATSPVGAYDMSGNVLEWCHDWCCRVYTTEPVTNPTGPTSGGGRLLRGGSWLISDNRCRSANRYNDLPDARGNDYGFRISRTP